MSWEPEKEVKASLQAGEVGGQGEPGQETRAILPLGEILKSLKLLPALHSHPADDRPV